MMKLLVFILLLIAFPGIIGFVVSLFFGILAIIFVSIFGFVAVLLIAALLLTRRRRY